MRPGTWKKYVDIQGDFEFPKYLYKSLTELMKTNLDLGTLVCNDPVKLRAYKEQVKKANQQLWSDIAEAFEYFDVVQSCVCDVNQYCGLCGGSRYILSDAVSANKMREMGTVIAVNERSDIAEKLREGMEKAIEDIKTFNINMMTINEAREALGYGRTEEE